MKIIEHVSKNLPFISSVPENNSNHLGIIFLLHGFGASMQDLVDIAPMINKDDYIFIFPNAPFEMSFGLNQKGYSWFDFDNLSQISKSQKILENTIEESLKLFNIDDNKMHLGGFSQGGMMAMHSDLIYQNLFSGYIILSSKIIPNIDINLKTDSRIFLAHGVNDSIIDIYDARETQNKLINRGLDVEYHEYEMEHQIIESELNDIKNWLL